VKPPLTIDLVAPEGNVFALVNKAVSTLQQAGQPVQATALRDWFRAVAPLGGVSYDDVRRMVDQYCDVTWLNEPAPQSLRKELVAIATKLGPGNPYLVRYEYTESGTTEWCAFVCTADNVQAAAESFWNQHPGESFHLVSVSDGNIEAFWEPRTGRFVTIPEREAREME
jgi:hypothetical protein